MNLSEQLLKIISEMSYNRTRFQARIRGDVTGALGEYICREISLHIGKPDYCTKEVKDLLQLVPSMVDRNAVRTDFDDREKALEEVFREISISHRKVLYGCALGVINRQ